MSPAPARNTARAIEQRHSKFAEDRAPTVKSLIAGTVTAGPDAFQLIDELRNRPAGRHRVMLISRNCRVRVVSSGVSSIATGIMNAVPRSMSRSRSSAYRHSRRKSPRPRLGSTRQRRQEERASPDIALDLRIEGVPGANSIKVELNSELGFFRVPPSMAAPRRDPRAHG